MFVIQLSNKLLLKHLPIESKNKNMEKKKLEIGECDGALLYYIIRGTVRREVTKGEHRMLTELKKCFSPQMLQEIKMSYFVHWSW